MIVSATKRGGHRPLWKPRAFEGLSGAEIDVRRHFSDMHPRLDAVLWPEHMAHTNDRQQRSNHGDLPTGRCALYVSIYERMPKINNILNAAFFQLVFSTHQSPCILNSNNGAFSNSNRAHVWDD